MGVDTIGRALAILRAHTSSLDIVRAAQDVVEMLAATEARAVSAEAEVAQMEAERRNVIDGLIADVAAARRERDTLAAEVKRLREELEKPVVDAWAGSVRLLDVCTVAWSTPAHFIPGKDEVGWWAQHPDGDLIASGPETGDAGRHAADLALLAAGYRLVGGAHPLPVECKHKWKNVPFSATGPDSDDGRDGPVCSICGEEWEVPDAR